jgi:hypothetical protein
MSSRRKIRPLGGLFGRRRGEGHRFVAVGAAQRFQPPAVWKMEARERVLSRVSFRQLALCADKAIIGLLGHKRADSIGVNGARKHLKRMADPRFQRLLYSRTK